MCSININQEYENVLFKSNLLDKNSPQLGKDRQKLFYTVCIPLRLLILFLLLSVSQIKNESIQAFTTITLFFIYLFSTLHLLSKKSKCQWWSNEYEILLCILALLVCLFVKENTVFLVCVIMFFSILGGIIQSVFLNPFSATI